jgi:hypothetical protein
MTGAELLAACRGAGVLLWRIGDTLEVEGPVGVLTLEVQGALVHLKAELLALVQPEYVMLSGGLTLPLDVVCFACGLENRGFEIVVDDLDEITVYPDALLTTADRAQLHRWRRHLPSVVRYCCAKGNGRTEGKAQD